MTKSNIRVFLVDDHQTLLDGLQLMLKATPDIEITGMAYNGKDLLDQLRSSKGSAAPVDVILMDINMPVMNGLEAARQVKLLYPHIKVIMLTMRDQMPDVNKAVAMGADGFLSKNNGKEEIISTIKRVYEKGEFVVHTDLDKTLIGQFPGDDNAHPKPLIITQREKQIICLICQEYDLDHIASVLSLSRMAISTHRKIILSKLGVNSDIGIVREALKRQICDDVELPYVS